jgi:hypothetical protein
LAILTFRRRKKYLRNDYDGHEQIADDAESGNEVLLRCAESFHSIEADIFDGVPIGG